MPAPTQAPSDFTHLPRTYPAPRLRPAYDSHYQQQYHPPHNPNHALYDLTPSPFSPLSSSSASTAMLNTYLTHSHPWHGHHQLHLFPPNPYPQPPPPPPIAHKVWILDCKSCGTFLTNRGMKAVLLLRPNVSLYSSDALPINCSAYTSNPDALRPRTSCNPPSSSSSPPRTCECLTQTLCCHGCGATVGYMIVIPCARCTSSITATNRATNGHRFVFHSSEIIGTERRYVQDEPGVIPFEPPLPTPTQSPLSPASSQYHSPTYPQPGENHSPLVPHLSTPPTENRRAPPSPPSDYLPTPPLEYADIAFASTTSRAQDPSPFLSGNISGTLIPHARPQLASIHPRSLTPSAPSTFTSRTASTSSDTSARPSNNTAEHKEHSTPRKLKPGDILFWHHLARNGEIPGVSEDPRARGRTLPLHDEKKLASKVVFNR
ncbi:hypothetical protein AX16_010664 [Volvariella volvacea WC 439]|nr:hypothetical protein AX16_010664 [Volvariella volvacea WC 439]